MCSGHLQLPQQAESGQPKQVAGEASRRGNMCPRNRRPGHSTGACRERSTHRKKTLLETDRAYKNRTRIDAALQQGLGAHPGQGWHMAGQRGHHPACPSPIQGQGGHVAGQRGHRPARPSPTLQCWLRLSSAPRPASCRGTPGGKLVTPQALGHLPYPECLAELLAPGPACCSCSARS